MPPTATIARLDIMLRMDHAFQLDSAIALSTLEARNKPQDARYASQDILSCIATAFDVSDVSCALCSSCANPSASLMLLLSTSLVSFRLLFQGFKC